MAGREISEKKNTHKKNTAFEGDPLANLKLDLTAVASVIISMTT